MSVSVNGPKTPLTKGSKGIAMATLPNICKMPGPPAPFVPAPLPNIGKTGEKPKGYSKKVKVQKKTVAIKGASFGSIGDMASKGTGGGMVSANTHGPCKFISPGSMDVKFEGKNVHLLSDLVTNNGGPSGSPANAATMMGTIQVTELVTAVPNDPCPICGEEHGALEETDPGTKTDATGLATNFKAEIAKVTAKGNALVPPVRVLCNTMLGVVECKCGKKYADQSGATTIELCSAAKGMKHPPSVKLSYLDGADAMDEGAEDTANIVEEGIQGHFGKQARGVWRLATDLSKVSRKDKNAPAAYHPGTCAAQKTLLLMLEDRALVSAMTERWFSAHGSKVKAKIEFVDLRENKKPYQEKGEFKVGDTVPPCKSCELIVPVLICTRGETACQHKG